MLHTVNKSPFQNEGLDSCLRFAKDGDHILLLEDGVYAAMAGTAKEAQVKAALAKYSVYAIGADLKARAVTSVVDGVQIIDYAGFVTLVENHKIHSWL